MAIPVSELQKLNPSSRIELFVLELVEVVERDVHPSEFSSISEAFLSSSTRDVVPVARIDDFELPNVPGLITSEVMVTFAALKAARLDP